MGLPEHHLSDVLVDTWVTWDEENDKRPLGEALQTAVLAYGGGDPVVVMPDGTLKRYVWVGPGFTDYDYELADPVQP